MARAAVQHVDAIQYNVIPQSGGATGVD